MNQKILNMTKKEKNLRDELAMSMPFESIPNLNNENAINLFAEQTGIEWDENDIFKQIEFSIRYQAHIRYMYADAMMKHRKK